MSLDIAEKLSFFRELVLNSDGLYSWCYDSSGTLVFTNAEQLEFCQKVFLTSRCLEKALAYSKTSTKPIMLSIGLGLVWVVDFQHTSEENLIHVLGPAFNQEVPLRDVMLSLEPYKETLGSNYSPILRKIQQFPIVSLLNMERCAVMLHYSITGEKILVSDMETVASSTIPQHEGRPSSPPDKHLTYKAEVALMRMVREGDLGYQDVLSNAVNIGTKRGNYSGTPLEQAKISQIIFATICTRAAIEGGMSPEASYSLGNAYIRKIQNCVNIAEIQSVGHTMYDDFIQKVHKLRTNPSLSPVIQHCCDYILTHVEDALSLELLAGIAGYSNYYFSRMFKKEMGCSLSSYIKIAKVERARLLLESTDLSIQQIADRLNMCSRTYFADAFRDITGISPAEYKRKRSKQPEKQGI